MKRLLKITLFLLLIIGSVLAIFWFKSERGDQRSFDLSDRVPESSFVGKVDISELANVIMRAGKLPLDSFHSKWTHYFRNPLKIGVDPYADPWLFGDSKRWCVAIQINLCGLQPTKS